MSEQETLTEAAEGTGLTSGNAAATEEKEGTIREYIVFVEQAPDQWRRLETIAAGDPGSALKAVGPDPKNRYAVVSARFWQVGKPEVKQITQVSIEFE